ncbi:MAG: IS5 family transposase [Bacteroidia bacterium]|nr:IS5 family transposase [Bacteroidia bacterium]
MTSQYSELTDAQWGSISEFFEWKRKRTMPIRSVVNAIVYLLRTGCQWRNLPPHFPKWWAVYYYFDKWNKDGTMDQVNLALNQRDRKRENRAALPSQVCIDSQRVKLAPMIFEHRGTDAHKRINGRKRQLVVDIGGRIFEVEVHAAHLHDGSEGKRLLPRISAYSERLEKMLADQSYQGSFAVETEKIGLIFECASKPESVKGFVPIAQRWVVERTLAGTNFFRRIVKDYEHTLRSAKYWLIWANISIILNRIT